MIFQASVIMIVSLCCSCQGMKVFVHSAAATPLPLVAAMAKWGKKAGLKNVEVIHIHTEGPGEHGRPEYEGVVAIIPFFQF